MEVDHLKNEMSEKTNYSRPEMAKALVLAGSQKYTFTVKLIIGDAKTIFNQAALDIGKYIVDKFNEVLMEFYFLCIFKMCLPQTEALIT